MGATGGSQSHGCLFMGENGSLDEQNIKLSHGLGTWKAWLSPKGFVAPDEGQIGLFLSVPLL